MKKLILSILFSLPLLAGSLNLQNGSIAAHAEMMMDSEINPVSTKLLADLKMKGDDIATLSGKFSIDLSSFISDNLDRDEHMYESLNIKNFMLASYTISSVSKLDKPDTYSIKGILNFNGQEKELLANAEILLADGVLEFNAKTILMMPQYGIEMPCMVFMCVDDRVDLVIKATLNY